MARTLGHLQPRPPLHSLLPSSALSSLSTPPLSSPPHPPRCPPAAGQRGGAGSGATQATRRAVGRRMCRRRKGQAQVADGGSGRRWPMPGATRAQLADGGRTVKVATGVSSLPSSFTLHARSRWGRENRMGASVMGWREER
uniref:Uncharacterized protein n=2 Tax=Oryza TaxID=4527 RepID=A0A0D3GIV8_9ORYZ